MIAILAYHSLDETRSVLSTSPAVFREQMRILRESGTTVAPLNEVLNHLDCEPPRQNAIVLTFDDGFQSVYEHALPVLEDYGLPATVFLVTDYCGKDNSWPGQLPSIRRQPLLRWSEIKAMSHAGVSFGSHTRTHPDLKRLPRTKIEEELVQSKKAIEDATGCAVDTLAYPYGAYDETVVCLAKEHFQLACSTQLGFVRPGSDPFALERIEMFYFRSPALFRRLFSRTVGAYVDMRRCLRELRRFGAISVQTI